MPSGLATLADHQQVWDTVSARKAARERARLEPPLVRFWDGDFVFRGVCAGWRSVDFEFIENDSSTASVKLSLDHYLSKWIMDHKGRQKRNVHVTIDKQGARWSGCMDHYRIVRTKEGDAFLEIIFKHDFEHTKHILVWSNPFLRAEFQFPKLWVIFGPSKWCLLMTLFVNLMRLETSLWTLPDNPLDIKEWMGPSFFPGNWRQIVKPFPLLGDNSNVTIVFSRFKSFYDVAKEVLSDAQLTMTCRRYLKDEDEHPFKDLSGELNVDWIEDLYSLIPLRNGCLVWDIQDNSGWGTETAFGGSLLTGLRRAAVTIESDGLTEGVDLFTGDPTFPGEYYTPGFLGTNPQAPWVVFEEGRHTGIESSEFLYYEATDTSIVGGGHSTPGVNEGISTAINIGGDFLTSLINSTLAPAGPFGGAIDLPPLGGTIDAVAKILYEDVILAFQEAHTNRAWDSGTHLPIAGLEDAPTSLGDFHYYEGWADGADRAFTISSMIAQRAKIFATRAHTAHTIKVADAAPYYLGDKGYGDFWLGSRIATSVLGYPTPHTLFVERVSKIKYKWDENGPTGWTLDVGYREPADPMMKAFKLIQSINSAISQLGIW